jgi:hypothetical protein
LQSESKIGFEMTYGVMGLLATSLGASMCAGVPKKNGGSNPPFQDMPKELKDQRDVALASFSRWDMQLRQSNASGMISSRLGSMGWPQTSQYP